jgi:uncharacterized YccA/Bax inhibitor family protein
MSPALAMTSGNPALSAETFRAAPVLARADAMTIEGTVNKTAFSLAILFIAATWVWSIGLGDPRVGGLLMLGVIGGAVTALVTVFKQPWAPYTTPAYAAFEGLALGGISTAFDSRYPGIASQAIFLTFGTLGGLLLAYRSGLIRATEKFKLGIFAATSGIALLYLIGFVLSFFGTGIPLIHGSGTVGILFSLFVCGVAALNLVIDFDMIEQGAARGAAKYMEWYGAFALLVTLVWLYLEILRLLSKLQEERR